MTIRLTAHRPLVLLLLLALLLALAPAALTPGTAAADEVATTQDDGVIEVTDTLDAVDDEGCSGPAYDDCTLREAVLEANGDPDIHTIVLGPGTYELTIAGAGEDGGLTGDLDVHADLTIVGAGSGETQIIADWELEENDNDVEAQDEHDPTVPDRLIHVHGDGTALTLAGLTLAGGEAASGDGGAILLEGDEPDDVVFAEALDDAMALATTDVVIRDSAADRNGGGVAATGTTALLELTDTVIRDNDALHGHGGGLHVEAEATHVQATDTDLVGNTADRNGGGAWLASVPWDDYYIRAADMGGEAGLARFEGGEIRDNDARRGAGLHLSGIDGHLSGTAVTQNDASQEGGGILIRFGDRFLLAAEDESTAPTLRLDADSTVSDNTATWVGGAIAAWGAHVHASDTDINGNAAEEGGAAVVDGGDVTLERVHLHDNEAGWNAGALALRGGGAPGGPAGDLHITDSSIAGNQSAYGTGAVLVGTDYFIGDSVEISGAEGSVEPQYDNGLPAYELTIEGSTFADNTGGAGGAGDLGDMETAVRAGGEAPGAIRVREGYHGAIVNSTFSGNEGVGAGAGLRVDELDVGDLELHHVTFADHALSGQAVPMLEPEPEPEPQPQGVALHISESDDAEPGSLQLTHVVLADSQGDNCGGDLDRIVSAGHNLDDDGTCGLGSAGDVVADALLGPLAANGGATLTHLPADDSPAVEGGQAGPCEVDVDQRGVARPQGDACDIGAVEVELQPEEPEEPVVPDPDRPFGCDPDAADRFGDVHPDGVHRDNIGCAADLGFVVGFTDGTYRPGIDMSRGQFATVVARMIEFILDDELPIDDELTFPDVPAGHVHEGGIRKLATAGLVVGFDDGDYRPGHSLRRGQAASILDAAIVTATGEQLPDGPTAFLDHRGSPHEHALDRLAQEGIVTGYGDGTVRPSLAIQRGQLASLVVRTLVAIEGLQVGAG